MQARGTVIDFVTLKHELASRGELKEIGGPAYLASLGDGIPRTLNVSHYAGIVRQCSARREVIRAANQLARSANEHDVDVIESSLRDTATAVAALGQRQSVTPVLVNMAQIERQDVRWLWANRLALGAMTLLAAEPGIGKSWLALEIAARLTANRELPGGPPLAVPMSVLIMAAEDAPETTIKNRLQSLRADMGRVHFCVDKASPSGQREPLRLADSEIIERAVVESGAKLLIIDPMNSFMAGCDSNNDVEVRRVITPLLRIARTLDMSILGLMHQTKNTSSQAIYRTLGSIAFNGIPRVVLNVVADKDDSRRRWLFTIKNNLGQLSEDRDAIAYALVRNLFVWDTSQHVDHDALLNAQTIGKDAPEQLTAVEFLQALLNDEREKWPLIAAATIDMAKRNGIAPGALQRARRSLGIQSRKQGFGKQAEWRWYKPRALVSRRKKPTTRLPLSANS
jgi:hypothetical protein